MRLVFLITFFILLAIGQEETEEKWIVCSKDSSYQINVVFEEATGVFPKGSEIISDGGEKFTIIICKHPLNGEKLSCLEREVPEKEFKVLRIGTFYKIDKK